LVKCDIWLRVLNNSFTLKMSDSEDDGVENYNCDCGKREDCGRCERIMCRKQVSHYCENAKCQNALCTPCWNNSTYCSDQLNCAICKDSLCSRNIDCNCYNFVCENVMCKSCYSIHEYCCSEKCKIEHYSGN
jgi:hypothetical protein